MNKVLETFHNLPDGYKVLIINAICFSIYHYFIQK